MRLFKILLFLTPSVCLIRVHWITIIIILMVFSLTAPLVESFKSLSSIPKSKIIHPIPSNILICLGVLILYQFFSFLWFDFEVEYLKVAIKKIILLIFNILIGIALLYAMFNQKNPDEQNKNFDFLAKGLILASVLFLFDHIVHHKIFSLIMPNMISDDDIGYKISQSHMGQVLCAVIVWPVAANLWIIGRKKYALFVIAMVGLIAILPFIFYKINYNAVLSFFIGLAVFIIFNKIKSFFIPLAISGFMAMIAIVPLAFNLNTDQASLYPNVKLSINHRICIWHYYTQKAYNSLIIGHGFNASETFGATEDITCAMVFPNHNISGLSSLVANGHHPHNIGLQVLLELGVIGFIIISVLGILLIYQLNINRGIIIRKMTMAIIFKQNIIKASILASFFTFLSFLIAAVNIWAGWVIATIFITIAISKMLILNNKRMN